jgi:hypothetical protein
MWKTKQKERLEASYWNQHSYAEQAKRWLKKSNDGDDYDDLNADSELLKEKRREELLTYEQLLFGENP